VRAWWDWGFEEELVTLEPANKGMNQTSAPARRIALAGYPRCSADLRSIVE